MLIVFEGINGAGKTTMINKVFDWLASIGKPVVLTKEPRGYFKQCMQISGLCSRAKALLYLAGRANHTNLWILPYQGKKTIVLCDRYLDSSIAYQVYGDGFDKELINKINDFATSNTRPDLTIYLDTEVSTGMERSGFKDFDYLSRVKSGYDDLKKNHKDYIVIDANKSIDEVYTAIKEAIKKKLEI